MGFLSREPEDESEALFQRKKNMRFEWVSSLYLSEHEETVLLWVFSIFILLKSFFGFLMAGKSS